MEEHDPVAATSGPVTLENVHPHLRLAETEPDDDGYYTFVVGVCVCVQCSFPTFYVVF